KDMLAEMRKYYNGKIGIGVVGSWRDCDYNFKEYDYLTFSAYPSRSRGIDPWLTPNLNVPANSDDAFNLAFLTSWARKVADRSGIQTLHIGETGVLNPTDLKRADASSYAEGDKQKEAEFYQKLFEQTADKVNGISVFYNSLNNYFSINSDPAEEVVKEWYNKLGPGIESKEETTKLIIANPLDLSQIARISKFRSCYGHDYSGLNIEGENETLRSMKHYIEFSSKFLGSKNAVKVFAPFEGKIAEILEAGGKQIFISADKDPQWNFIFFHITIEPDIKVGTAVKAGQLVGHAYVREWPNFDFALKEFSRTGETFESPFLHMQDSILDEYASYGVTPENIIVTRQFRDIHPCPIKGAIDGEEAFTGETEKEDFVVLK
ncbi:hypothetical protein HYV83_00170, partial [Candidatus Woesearchaeota archaeon]|nr:hypothetical protein [Candidatus Woesearchaeota archaeon]